MASHFILMLVFSGFVSVVFAVLMRDEPPEQLRVGVSIFTGFVIVALIGTWLMYPFPL